MVAYKSLKKVSRNSWKLLATQNFDRNTSTAHAGTLSTPNYKLVQRKQDQVSPLRVQDGPRPQSPSKCHFINGHWSQESTTTMWGICIIALLSLSSEKSLPTHNMTNFFTTNHIISFGSAGNLHQLTFMGSSIHRKLFSKPTRTSTSLHQNWDATMSVSSLLWCFGLMPPNPRLLVMQNCGLATCFLEMSQSIEGANPLVVCAAMLHISIMYILAIVELKMSVISTISSSPMGLRTLQATISGEKHHLLTSWHIVTMSYSTCNGRFSLTLNS